VFHTQAHIITKQQNRTFQQDPSSAFLEAGCSTSDHYSYAQAQLQLHTRDQDVQEMFTKKASAHMPYVYTLPMDVSLEQTPELRPCSDIPFLDARLKHDISSLTGVPSELLISRGVANESSVRTRTSTHQFHANMDCIAQTIQRLLADVYRRAYHNDAVSTFSFPGEYSSTKQRIVDKPQTNAGAAVDHATKKQRIIDAGASVDHAPEKPTNNSHRSHDDPSKKRRKPTITPKIEWFLEVAPMLELDTVDDLVKLASIEGALNPIELRRVVQMLLYGKPAGSSSCMGPIQSSDAKASVSVTTDTGASSAAPKKSKTEVAAVSS